MEMECGDGVWRWRWRSERKGLALVEICEPNSARCSSSTTLMPERLIDSSSASVAPGARIGNKHGKKTLIPALLA